jgi:YHS domain-containing protein
MKYFLILLMSLGSFAQVQAQKDAVYSTKNGAIKGYDPVAYFTDGKPVKGLDSIALNWQGATWHFANSHHRELFIAEPEKYAPQFGGWCAYGWSKGYPAKIEPEAWSIVDNKLYLNYNLEVRDDWEKKRAEYIQKAEMSYQKVFKKSN